MPSGILVGLILILTIGCCFLYRMSESLSDGGFLEYIQRLIYKDEFFDPYDYRKDQNLAFRRVVNHNMVSLARWFKDWFKLTSMDARDANNCALRSAALHHNWEMVKFLKYECGLKNQDAVDTQNKWVCNVWHTL